MKVLCFEVWKNDKKVALAGLRGTGVVSFTLTWVSRSPDTPGLAITADGLLQDVGLNVGGLDSSGQEKFVDWFSEGIDSPALRLDDEFRIRLISSDSPDEPREERSSARTTTQTGSVHHTQCSFCTQMRQTEPKDFFGSGVMGANHFICTRCLVLAEQMLDDKKLNQLFHLSRATGKSCSFCVMDRSPETACSGESCICKACIDDILKDTGEPQEQS